jgi:meiotic recombination protein SPO11
MPDIQTRKLAHEIYSKFKLPSYCLVDANPFGIQIMIIYKYGSQRLQQQEHQDTLIVPNLTYIGLNIKDCLNVFKLNRNNYYELSDIDKGKALNLLNKDFIKNENDLKEQLELMLKYYCKCELQCLQTIKHNFLCDVYLKMKIPFDLFHY